MPDDTTRCHHLPRHDPQALLAIGTTMNDRLAGVIMEGYAAGADEDEMIMTIFNGLVVQSASQTAVQAMAALFALAQASQWDLVLARPDDTRAIIHCDTEEEQLARALEVAKGQTVNKEEKK